MYLSLWCAVLHFINAQKIKNKEEKWTLKEKRAGDRKMISTSSSFKSRKNRKNIERKRRKPNRRKKNVREQERNDSHRIMWNVLPLGPLNRKICRQQQHKLDITVKCLLNQIVARIKVARAVAADNMNVHVISLCRCWREWAEWPSHRQRRATDHTKSNTQAAYINHSRIAIFAWISRRIVHVGWA